MLIDQCNDVILLQQCFDRLEDFGIYAEEFLEPYERKLHEIQNILEIDSRENVLPESALKVVTARFNQCSKLYYTISLNVAYLFAIDRIYQKLLDTIHEVSPEL